MTSPGQRTTLSPVKWLLGVIALVTVMVSCGGLGLWLTDATNRPAVAPHPLLGIVTVVLGIVVLVIGAIGYALVLATSAFMFNFTRPITRRLGPRVWTANLVVGFLLQTGVALMAAPVVAAVLWRFLPGQFAMIASFFIPFIVAQLVLIWLLIWAPLERLTILRRLRARSVSEDALLAGIPLGLSDPAKSSFKKLTIVEEDLGRLWLEPRLLRYMGDAIDFTATPAQVLTIEQKADAGSTAAYFGASHVIVHFVEPDGTERRARLHAQGQWTQTGKARALDALADRLRSWHAAGAGEQAS